MYFVYILASKRNGALYIGVTNDLVRRVQEYKDNLVKGFTQKYGIHSLVYYEHYNKAEDAINREKNMKAWQRTWKLRVIEAVNPKWKDLSEELLS